MKLGNLKYREMFFNPTLHTSRGVPYADGRRRPDRRHPRAEERARRRLPPDRRRLPPGSAGDGREMVQRGPRAPPRRGHRARHGRRRGARSAGEVRRGVPAREARRPAPDGARQRGRPAENITTCLDVLGCERIDHGYHILGDAEVVERTPRRGDLLHGVPDGDRRLLLRRRRPDDAPDPRDGRRRVCASCSTPTTRRCSTPTSAGVRRAWSRPPSGAPAGCGSS